jgi:hypothetical protein
MPDSSKGRDRLGTGVCGIFEEHTVPTAESPCAINIRYRCSTVIYSARYSAQFFA